MKAFKGKIRNVKRGRQIEASSLPSIPAFAIEPMNLEL
jgi:hypothetical protein